jgi:hypothetical protein
VDVIADDPAAVVRLRDVRGKVRMTDVGGVYGRLRPDLYYAVLANAYGHEIVKPVEVDWWRRKPMRLVSPLTSDGFRSGIAAADELQWASGAALAALDVIAATRHLPPEEPVIGVYGTERLPVAKPAFVLTPHALVHTTTLPMQELHHVPHGWAIHLTAIPFQAQVGIAIWDQVLVVPTLPGVATGVFLGEKELTIGLYDRQLASRSNALLLLDRVQQLLWNDLPYAAAAVLNRLGDRLRAHDAESSVEPILASHLLGSQDRDVPPGLLAVDAAPEHRHQLLGGPWDVRMVRHDEEPGSWLIRP